MNDDHPCCKALEQVKAEASDGIGWIYKLQPEIQRIVEPLKDRLDRIRALCDSVHGT
ncbi:MAG: hypothetical protein IVW54_18565 [Candidatus Binataceae bacterium]|nr:hypothetical protein [Candidatus Binataceae bacterium]